MILNLGVFDPKKSLITFVNDFFMIGLVLEGFICLNLRRA